ncbi:hypothetical protein PoB_000425300 [Plakobranchus ocellatus]|uniref:Uncharacterized protein n=1 Tax=Plakobranchus ocellatus TaxID=259542 RepID=A0AAV3Y5A5_9GAST|nr:hypothetical protein PoB_000425300 [Plakobranchus ocellatus]
MHRQRHKERQKTEVWFLYKASPQQGDLRLSDPPSEQGAIGWAQVCERRIPADLRVDSLAIVPPTPPFRFKDEHPRSLQQGDLMNSSSPSGQGVVGGSRAHVRRVPADPGADSQATAPPTPPIGL